MADEPARGGISRSTWILVAAGIALLVMAIVVALVLGGGGGPSGTLRGRGSVASPEPAVPSFRFSPRDRVVVPTSSGKLTRRVRAAGLSAATATSSLLSDLYTEAFLDPANWGGRYDEVLRMFAGGARSQARERVAVLTAGVAADRVERIVPILGKLQSRILVDRSGKPTLVVSLVRFRAQALGADATQLRSTAQFFFERVDGRWRIVSFDVDRRDQAGSDG